MTQVGHSYSGIVLSGRGKAREHLEAEYDGFLAATGEELIPGSLNVILSQPVLLKQETALLVSEGTRLLWRAELSGLPIWIYRFRHAPLHMAEILSSVRLRDALRLQDGDTVTLRVSDGDVDALGLRRWLAWQVMWKGRRSWCYHKDGYYLRTRKLSMDLGATQKPIQLGVLRSLVRFIRRGFK